MFLFSATTLVSALSLATVIDAAAVSINRAGLLRSRTVKITSCKGAGQYPLPISNQCKPCSYKFTGAATCTATAATRCLSGFLSAGACVTTCPTGTYNQGGTCLPCSSKFPGAAACTASAATRCTTGYLANGACPNTCPSGFVNSPSTRTCVACQRFDAQAATCAAGKIATCSTGSYLNSAGNDCVPCTSVNQFASTCSSSSVVTACISPYSVSTDKKSCVLGTSWSYYLSSSIPNIPYNSNVNSPITCARGAVGKGAQATVYDAGSQTCFSTTSSATTALGGLMWDAESSVIILGTCKQNNAAMPAAKARCHDATLTTTSCTLSDRTACSTLLASCEGSQFRNYNGLCQDCTSAYADAVTCDLFNGATSCIDGDFLNNGTCTSCSTFDDNASGCAADGTLSGCNDGWVLSGNTCIVDTSAPASTGLDNDWSYYVDSMVSGLTVLNTNSVDQYDCAESVYGANSTLAAFDPVTNNCYSANSTDTLTGSITDVAGASVFVLNTCAFNQGQVPSDQANNCYDITLDSESCLNGGAPCS